MKYGAIVGSTVMALLLGGCAVSNNQEPTHRWVSTVNSSSAEYRADNGHCTREISGDSSQRVFEVNTPAYAEYVACMNARGYALTAMNSRN